MGDYYLPTWYIPVASRVAVPSKIDAYPSEEGPFSLEDFPPIFLNDYQRIIFDKYLEIWYLLISDFRNLKWLLFFSEEYFVNLMI